MRGATTPRRHAVVMCGMIGLLALTGCVTTETNSALGYRPGQPGTTPPPNMDAVPPTKIGPKTYFAAGQLHEREGNYLAAAEQYYRATQADPKYVMALNRLGIVYNQLRLFDRADSTFAKAIDLAPDAAFLRNNRAFTAMLRGDYDAAEKHLREAIRMKPDYKRSYTNLGVVLARTNRGDEAVETFARVLPRDVALYNVGVLYVADGRYEDARDSFELALDLVPSARAPKAQLDRLKHFDGNPDSRIGMEFAAASERIAREFGPPPVSSTVDVISDEIEIREPQRATVAPATEASERDASHSIDVETESAQPQSDISELHTVPMDSPLLIVMPAEHTPNQ